MWHYNRKRSKKLTKMEKSRWGEDPSYEMRRNISYLKYRAELTAHPERKSSPYRLYTPAEIEEYQKNEKH